MSEVRIYIAGPLFGSGRSTENVHKALCVAEAVRNANREGEPKAYPFVPHLFHFWDSVFPNPDENYWLDMDRVWLKQCHMLLVIPGVSPGTRKEELWAKEYEIQSYTLPSDCEITFQGTVLQLCVSGIYNEFLHSVY